MIAKPDTTSCFKLLASAVFLLFSLNLHPQQKVITPIKETTSRVEHKGLSSSQSAYYTNLMMQDLAVPQQIPVDQISFITDFSLKFRLEKIGHQKFELKVWPADIHCHPLDYFGFDVSPSLTPDYASFTFKVVNSYGFTEDSVIFSKVHLRPDTSLYVSKTFTSGLANPGIEFSALQLTYEEEGYERFRRDISYIDDYYAATALLDSLLRWTDRHFPTGQGSVWGNYLQQLEIGRILDYLENSAFTKILAEGDPSGYTGLLEQAGRKKIRSQAILERQLIEELDGIDRHTIIYWIDSYILWLNSYEKLASGANHRFGNFYTGLQKISPSNGMIVHEQMMMKEILAHLKGGDFYADRLFLIGKLFTWSFMKQANERLRSGDQVKALFFYDNALRVSTVIPGADGKDTLRSKIHEIGFDLARSFLDLSWMAAGKGSVGMAEGYFNKAVEKYSELNPPVNPSHIRDFEKQLLDKFRDRAMLLTEQKKFAQALEYLEYLQDRCSEGRYTCGNEIQDLSYEIYAGLYDQKLTKASWHMDADETEQCSELLREALVLRRTSGSRIDRDKREAELTSRLDQFHYDESVSEGKRYLNYGESEIALYYLNKARLMESSFWIKQDQALPDYLRMAAKPVILRRIESGQARARGYYFEESWEILNSCREMIQDYGMAPDSVLAVAMSDLENNLRSFQCEKLQKDYDGLLEASLKEKDVGHYLRALEMIDKSIGLSLNDTVCQINDQDAWYERALLEYPAEFEKRQNKTLELVPDDPEGFITSYQELSRYYQSHHLAQSGVEFIPLHERVMLQSDPAFLGALMTFYYRQKDKEKALEVMNRNWQKNHDAPSAGKQKNLAGWMAREDFREGGQDPLKNLNQYLPAQKPFRTFRYHYKLTWFKESGWKIANLSLFLKNQSRNN